jgi:hypothetical protein
MKAASIMSLKDVSEADKKLKKKTKLLPSWSKLSRKRGQTRKNSVEKATEPDVQNVNKKNLAKKGKRQNFKNQN